MSLDPLGFCRLIYLWYQTRVGNLAKVLAASVHVPILRTIGFYYEADLADNVTEKASPCTHAVCLWSADS
jgi:hypothetical protein